MARKRIEESHQVAFVGWFRLQYPRLEKLLFIIANGENVGSIRMKRLKQMGLVPGMPDLMLSMARQGFHGLYIEMKTEDGHLELHQVEQHKALREQDYKVVTCYGWEEAKAEINAYFF